MFILPNLFKLYQTVFKFLLVFVVLQLSFLDISKAESVLPTIMEEIKKDPFNNRSTLLYDINNYDEFNPFPRSSRFNLSVQSNYSQLDLNITSNSPQLNVRFNTDSYEEENERSQELSDNPYLRIKELEAELEKQKGNSKTIRILSLDGGGVRGVMEAYFLKELEKYSGKSISEMFHMIGGTSIGGIITGALTVPEGQGNPKTSKSLFSAQYIYDVLRTRSKEMFQKNCWSCCGFFGPQYKHEPVENILEEFFGDHTFDRTTNDALAVTYDLKARKPKIFKSWDTSEIFYTKDIMAATSAAPTYFKPRLIFPVHGSHSTHAGYSLSDGGTTANNPTACLLADAKRLYPDIKNFEIVSLGTGNGSKPLKYKTMENAGKLGWVLNLVDIFMNGQSTQTNYIIDTLFSDQNYTRWNPELELKNIALDNTNDENIEDLIHTEEQLIRRSNKEFNALCERLQIKRDDLVAEYPNKRRKSALGL